MINKSICLLGTGSLGLGAGSWEPRAGSWELGAGAGSWELGAGSWHVGKLGKVGLSVFLRMVGKLDGVIWYNEHLYYIACANSQH